MTVYFIQAFIYLCAAVITVPLAKRLGLGSVLGYLVAGVFIGPVTGLVGHETATIQHFAEFGVVMMLFLVGLELEPKSFWAMRHRLLGLGGLQLGLTTAAAMGIALLLGLSWSVALTVGLILSLSSTAIVLQTLNEKGLSGTEGGKSAFSVLLFQDIAVIPILALIPLLALPELAEQAQLLASSADQHEELNLVAGLPPWAHALAIIGSIAGLIAGGYFVSRPLFRYVADSGLREIFTATSLMLVIGIAALMSLVGLSPALGAFLAGVVLANSEFRHAIEADLEPFKGLLLGLFFITVGAGINFTTLEENLVLVLLLAGGLMLIKSLVLLLLALVFKLRGTDRWLFTLSLAQAGEFGFVLIGYTSQNAVLPMELAEILALVVALSMFLTPALFIFFDKVVVPRYAQDEDDRAPDEIDTQAPVIIAGIGRFGQIVNRLLVANEIQTVVLDHTASQVDLMRSINIKSYFGDASRADLLRTAGIGKARLLIVAIDDQARAIHIVKYAKKWYPNLRVLARAYDRGHGYQLRDAGADLILSETSRSALEMGGEALKELGIPPDRVSQLKETFAKAEKAGNEKLYQSWRCEEEGYAYTQHYQDLFMKLEGLLADAMKEESPGNNPEEEST
jgi:monovalent cation:proton antiporter-2 (CPA2) family protein